MTNGGRKSQTMNTKIKEREQNAYKKMKKMKEEEKSTLKPL